MIVLGLTGSVGMGKSTVAGMIRARGVPVNDADAVVHRLYAGAAVPLIEAAFPGTVVDGVVDRGTLGRLVFGDDAAMKRLEALVHPLVARAEIDFLAAARATGHRVVVLDIPLLFEIRAEGRVDAIATVSAPAAVQRDRVLRRPGMTAERLAAVLARQMPDDEKRRRSHFVVDTSGPLEATRRQVAALLRTLAGMQGKRRRDALPGVAPAPTTAAPGR
ncbi:dephospho-CoA kinase [Segnochrobactrum spirostomi]|uniref:Dephospho-CoA kinase n=1 Tax=Segnochrobactrum spirostomi TaxID=2608987 RepID=A0A6A7Y2D6_9HYPH|nr:dephospho-CoA kinase [Segnochrobactrum spirostomi]MQT12885.1 dephospho-CoA kinase [Segnochrobactrum spirostomi]